jgi:hypothetical protein
VEGRQVWCLPYIIYTYNIKLYRYICGPQTQLTTSLFFKTSLHVSGSTGHLQVITIIMTFNTCCFEYSHSTAIHPLYSWLWGLSDRLRGLVVRVPGYRPGGPGSIPDITRKKCRVSGTGSTQPREYNWGATWLESSGCCLENREYGRRDPSRWPCGTLYSQKLAITSPTSGCRSVGIVCSRTQTMEFSFMRLIYCFLIYIYTISLTVMNIMDVLQ